MIGALTGRIVDKQPERLVVDVQGVGYQLHVPLSTFYELGDPGATVSLRVHTYVREDTLALAVLSGIEPPDLVRAVMQGDVDRLTRIPGVGKKTAERIGLELKDRLPAGLGGEPDAGGETPSGGDQGDAVSALLNLGYHRTAAERAVRAAVKSGAAGFERTLRQALREVSK